jgi:hypothetical protein
MFYKDKYFDNETKVLARGSTDTRFISLKAGLHYGDYRSKLVGFKTQQNIFYLKSPSLRRLSP